MGISSIKIENFKRFWYFREVAKDILFLFFFLSKITQTLTRTLKFVTLDCIF